MILIIDFGSQFNQLIARRVRECRVYCQIEPPNLSRDKMLALAPEGIILSGGPASIYTPGSPKVDPAVFSLGVPVLGICYGMQFMVHALGGRVEAADKREYGPANLSITEAEGILEGIPSPTTCWMSHGDRITALPEGFSALATTPNSPYAVIQDPARRCYGMQFHPEVVHTAKGKKMLANFLFAICGCRRSWTMKSFARDTVRQIRDQVGDKPVILGLSGGVDSAVAALLIHRAVGAQLTCIFVDNGLLRRNEAEQLREKFKQHLKINIRSVNAGGRFLKALAGVGDPERKRKIIGRVFMEIFEAEAKKIEGARFLGQGTLYPDVIESRSAFGGPSAVIKSHHNVGGLPKRMRLQLVEPLKY
ncbi:MAG: glutamine-hydrolyzing GMP synthase, partial [Desulfobacteraceae bacterium]|nr:glutamine-hydrolyzing GMP synthase [Desulfobacteraceae bacterium]